ncbi:MAG: hypothetical protein ACOYD1_07650 [Candidatus Nanopelagicales bacterium]
MWLISTHGYLSLVQDRDDSNILQVRARVRDDIIQHFPHAKVFIADGGDYRYRARISRAQVAVRLADYILNELVYTSHFKDEAIAADKKNTASRRTAYYSCWNALAQLQDYAPYSKTPRGVSGVKSQFGGYGTGTSRFQPSTAGTPAARAWPKINAREAAREPDPLDRLYQDGLDFDLDRDTPPATEEDEGDLFYSEDVLTAIEDAFGVNPDTLSDEDLEDLIDQLSALHTHDGLEVLEEDDEDADTDDSGEPSKKRKPQRRRGKRKHASQRYVNRRGAKL